MSLDLKEVLVVRKNRKSRDSRPFKNYLQSTEKLNSCLSYIIKNNIDNKQIKEIICKSITINQVTNIEVYCKDMLDYFFKICNPSFTKESLKDIHKIKYDIDDLIYMHENSVHPIELIAFNQSFQNLSTIDNIFSKILKVKVFEEIKNLQIREKGKEDIVTFSDEQIFKKTNLLFDTRHELVHNPSNKNELTINHIEELLDQSITFIFGLDIVLSNNFTKHK